MPRLNHTEDLCLYEEWYKRRHLVRPSELVALVTVVRRVSLLMRHGNDTGAAYL